MEVTRLRGAEEDAKNNANRVTSLLEELERLRKDLQNTQKEKKAIEDWARTYQDEMEQVLGVCLCKSVFLGADICMLARGPVPTGALAVDFQCHSLHSSVFMKSTRP